MKFGISRILENHKITSLSLIPNNDKIYLLSQTKSSFHIQKCILLNNLKSCAILNLESLLFAAISNNSILLCDSNSLVYSTNLSNASDLSPSSCKKYLFVTCNDTIVTLDLPSLSFLHSFNINYFADLIIVLPFNLLIYSTLEPSLVSSTFNQGALSFIQSFPLPDQPIKLVSNILDSSFILVVCDKVALVLSIVKGNFQLLVSIPCINDNNWINASFASIKTLILSTADLQTYLFYIGDQKDIKLGVSF